MALQSTLFRFHLQISDTDRGIYESKEIRVAMHPSESAPYFLTRILAYALNYGDGLEFSQGISTPDEPALFIKDLTGQLLYWIDVGNPSSRRLHRAAKAARHVRIYTYRDFEILRREMDGEPIHKAGEIEIFSFAPSFLRELGESLERDNAWDVLVTQNELSVTVRGTTFHCEIGQHRLSDLGK